MAGLGKDLTISIITQVIFPDVPNNPKVGFAYSTR